MRGAMNPGAVIDPDSRPYFVRVADGTASWKVRHQAPKIAASARRFT
jgi:hypothetical protein